MSGPSDPHPPRRRRAFATGMLWAVLAAGALLRLPRALGDHGIYWPDEVYQSLEPAHRWVFGYGLIAWEFVEGARSWTFPGAVGLLLWACRLLGIDDPATYLAVVRSAFVALSVGTAAGAFALARALGSGRWPSLGAAGVVALAGPIAYFGHRAMSETASALPVVLGLWLLLGRGRRDQERWARVGGASLLGLAVLLRLQNAVFCVALALGWALEAGWAWRARPARGRGDAAPGALAASAPSFRALGEVLVVLAGFALLYGLLDRLTWGGWFHSAGVYLRFNLIEGKAAAWGTSPPSYYARVLFTSMPALTLLLVGFGLAGVRRAPTLALCVLAFAALHIATPHKELRFLLPMFAPLAALAAVGVQSVLGTVEGGRAARLASGFLLLAAAISGLRAGELTFGELGAYEAQKPRQSAWDDFGAVNRLLLRAHRQADLCGLKAEAVHLAWTGGHSYLHREVPLYPHDGPPRHSGRFNYVLTGAGTAGGEEIAREGPYALVRLGPSCIPDPGYGWRLP